MEAIETAELTTEGYIKIPKKIRKRLQPHTKFVILSRDDTMTLKQIHSPSEDFEKIVEWGTKFAKEKRITPEDVLKDD